MLGCSDGSSTGVGSRELPEHIADGNWHRVALQIRPDHWAECYIDGDLVARYEISEAVRTPTGVLFIGGRSYETRIYHGPVLVTRGLRY